MPVPAPTVGRFVQVNIGTDAEPAWRPAIVTAVWPHEYGSHSVCPVGLNVQVVLDGFNDERLVARHVGPGAPAEDAARRGLLWMTSLAHEGQWSDANDQANLTARRWRWPPREGA